MRMKIYHADLKNIFEKFGREWFHTYSFYNMYDDIPHSIEVSLLPKKILADFTERGYIIRKNGKKVRYSNNWSNYPVGFETKEQWRLSGKAIYELIEVLDNFDEEMTDQDHVDIVKIKLIE